jgi:hypothetical protein
LSVSDTAPGVVKVEPDPPIAAMTAALSDVRVTVLGPLAFEPPVEAVKLPELPLASRRPFVITAVRTFGSVAVEMTIVPLKPFWKVGEGPPPATLLVKTGEKVSRPGMLCIGRTPSCVIVMGIEPGLVTGPCVVNVSGLPPVANTKSVVLGWEKARMVAALAGVDSATAATQTAANRVSLERMVLLLPL